VSKMGEGISEGEVFRGEMSLPFILMAEPIDMTHRERRPVAD